MNNDKELKIKLLELKQKKYIYLARKKAKEDLIFLAEEILGYPKFGKIHREIELFLKNLENNAVILLPRRHFKTTFITISWTIQQLIINPNLRIFITNERLENAKSFLREIKNHFEKNDKFRMIFGDWTNLNEKWTETQIIIKPRTLNRKEPSIQVGSLDTSLVSQHFDIIIADDLVSRNNIGTNDQIEKVKQYFKDLISLLDTGGKIIDIGTRWHFNDLHGYLIEQGYKSFIKSCWDENGEPILPEKFTKKDLLEIKKEIGSYDFSCLYENNPIDDENADFKREWFKYVPETYILEKRKNMNCFITIDPAVSKKTSADYTGVIINYVDEQNNWYIKAKRMKIDTGELVNFIFDLYLKEKPTRIGIEKTTLTEGIKPFIRDEQKRRRIFFLITDLEHKQTSKEIRIRGLVPRYQSGTIFHIENQCNDLEDELLRFPKGKHDDLIDALSYQSQIVFEAIPEIKSQEIENKTVIQNISPFEPDYNVNLAKTNQIVDLDELAKW